MSIAPKQVPAVIIANPSEIKSVQNPTRRLSIVREFCLNTSTHALPGIARSNSIHNRLFWLFSFVTFTGIMVYFIVAAILAYFSYPTDVDINIVSEWQQYFPAVSVCNFAPMRLDLFYEAYINFTVVNNLTKPNASITSTYNIQNLGSFAGYTLNNNKTLDKYFFSLETMLYSCTFNNQPCSTLDFISFTSSYFGSCYTFNAKLKSNKSRDLKYANQYGGEGVLELEFYIHSHQYVPNIFSGKSINYFTDDAYFLKLFPLLFDLGYGMMALVHDNTQLPLIEKAGICLATGRKHKLGYRKKTNYFLSPPYTACTDKVSTMMAAMFDNYAGADYQYSESICFQLCGQVYAYEQCECVNPYLWSGRSILKTRTSDELFLAPICEITDVCYPKALDTLMASPDLLKMYCPDCLPQCSITHFIVQKSAFSAPNDWQMENLKAFVENSSVPLTSNWSTTWQQDIVKNYIGLVIMRETNIVENNTQSAKMGIVDVLSNIGGQTGLWIGISFLSIMELIEMIYRLIRHEIYSFAHRISNR